MMRYAVHAIFDPVGCFVACWAPVEQTGDGEAKPLYYNGCCAGEDIQGLAGTRALEVVRQRGWAIEKMAETARQRTPRY